MGPRQRTIRFDESRSYRARHLMHLLCSSQARSNRKSTAEEADSSRWLIARSADLPFVFVHPFTRRRSLDPISGSFIAHPMLVGCANERHK